ncbi:MAG: putative membrane protein [Planctomycetota bacterium]|jgi:uncharacterized membrane protein
MAGERGVRLSPAAERDPLEDDRPYAGPSADEKAPNYESSAPSRSEYITAMVHLYRGEMYRATTWRIRLDNTTNWAVLTTAGMITFTFGEGTHSHWVLLVGLAMVSVFLMFEARRFRYADVWRARVRMIEENFYGPILRRDPRSPEAEWGRLFARDLFDPRFTITRLQALRARFVRNYWALFVVIIAAWVVRVATFPVEADSWEHIKANLRMGMLIPWWVPIVYLSTVLLGTACIVLFTDRIPDPMSAFRDWDSHESRTRILDL